MAANECNIGSATTDSLLDHLVDFLHYAYGFYTLLLQEHAVSGFKSIWCEQLGDLARYRMAVAGLAHRMAAAAAKPGQELSRGHVQSLASHHAKPKPAARLDDDDAHDVSTLDQASIGDTALDQWDVDEADSWRRIAVEWYSQGLLESPGTGRFHHHLALLSKGNDLKMLFHFCKRFVFLATTSLLGS